MLFTAGQIPYPGMDPLLQAQAAAAAGAYQRQPTLIPPRVNGEFVALFATTKFIF